jgi:ABC-2 type transport system ATP-binding protein
MSTIQAKNLTKDFNGFRAVDNIFFEVRKGEIFGLLGPNGAGKTTTIRMLVGILKPTKGEAYIGKYNVQRTPIEARQIMGIVPEMANAYIDLSAFKNLLLMGELYGIEKEKSIKKAENLLKLFRLYGKKDQKVKTFSKGMKQRLILAMALMNDSEVLFLDEPTAGLDVESVRLIRDLIRKFNKKGITIFLTTHNIEEANLLCDRVAIMNYGKIVVIDRPEKLKHTIQSTSSIEVAFKKAASKEELKFEGVIEVKKTGDKFKLYSKEIENVIPLLIKYSQDSNNKIISLKTLGPSLEDVFVKLTKNEEK